MLDSICHMTLTLLESRIYGVITQYFAIFYVKFKWTSLPNVTKSVNH